MGASAAPAHYRIGRRPDCFRLERQLAGRVSHPLGHSAFPRRTKILKVVPLVGEGHTMDRERIARAFGGTFQRLGPAGRRLTEWSG